MSRLPVAISAAYSVPSGPIATSVTAVRPVQSSLTVPSGVTLTTLEAPSG